MSKPDLFSIVNTKTRMRERSGFYFLPLTFSLLLKPHPGFW